MNKKLDGYHNNIPGDYYDRAIEQNLLQRFWHKRRFTEVGKILADIRAEKILDIGCHGGRFTFELARHYQKALIFGIDVSKKAIDYAKARYPKISFQIGRAERLPYQKESFDLVTCFEVLEHLDDPKQAICEIRRVLRKEGTTLIIVPTENLLFKLIWLFWSHFGPGRVWHHTHVQKFTNYTLDRMLEEEGFVVVERKLFLFSMLLLIRARRK